MLSQRVVKPKKRRIKRVLKKREPKLTENVKQCLVIKGGNTSQTITSVLNDLHRLKKPHGVLFKKKNIVRPFEDESSLEFFSQKSDASLFMFGCHSKKRPNNLILGRMYDAHVLDMVEFGVEKYLSLEDFVNTKVSVGTKPCLLFAGEEFEQNETWKRVKNMLIDIFQGEHFENVTLNSLEHVWQFIVVGDVLYVRSYRIILKKSGSRVPRVELEEIGPTLDLKLRRHKLATDDLFKKSCKQPKQIKGKKIKNISHDLFGTKFGRIHMERQDLSRLQIKKMKGLKRSRVGKRKGGVDGGKSRGESKNSREEI